MSTNHYEKIKNEMRSNPKNWLITGVAGFIGSNLLEHLLKLNQNIVGIDNFLTGKHDNLLEVRDVVTGEQWGRFHFIESDIRNLSSCENACKNVHYVLHQAAIGSVPLSIEDPITCNEINVTGTINVMLSARNNNVKRIIYASSCSVYGDHPALPKKEEFPCKLMSPYAVTKYVNELYADAFCRVYGMQAIGLRYFNIFGPRQDPEGAYAAVIPKWITSMINREPTFVNGNGKTSRDFCFVENAVQMNLLAAYADNPDALGKVYNVGLNQRTRLNDLFDMLRAKLSKRFDYLLDCKPAYKHFREGDILHSEADIERARCLLGYSPTHTLEQGIDEVLDWYVKKSTAKSNQEYC